MLPPSAESAKSYYVCMKCFRSLDTANEDVILKVGAKLSIKSLSKSHACYGPEPPPTMVLQARRRARARTGVVAVEEGRSIRS